MSVLSLARSEKEILDDVYLIKVDELCAHCHKEPVLDMYPELHEELNRVKSKIDAVDDNTIWDAKKKLANPYEMISSNYRKGGLKILVKPLSRAYFKLWEILHDYELLPVADVDTPIAVACLAEGPGGFMEAVMAKRRYMSDRIVGITLPVEDERTPGWERIVKKTDERITVTYGDLYLLPDILRFAKNFVLPNGSVSGSQTTVDPVNQNAEVLGKAYLVTADGGLDFSGDYNMQEKMALRLIFAEIVTAFTVQEIGGNFVCKIFDIFSVIMVKCMYLLSNFYEEVHICKPKVSRPANSEKYLVAKGFRGISESELHKLYELLVTWNDDVVDICGITPEKDFIYKLKIYNRRFVKEQISHIERILQFIKTPLDKVEFQNIIDVQTRTAIEWCRNYNVQYTTSNFFKKN